MIGESVAIRVASHVSSPRIENRPKVDTVKGPRLVNWSGRVTSQPGPEWYSNHALKNFEKIEKTVTYAEIKTRKSCLARPVAVGLAGIHFFFFLNNQTYQN